MRVAEVVSALEAVGVSCLVLGGHAVRFYGFARSTNDVDLHIAPEQWEDLEKRLVRTQLFAGPAFEGPTWRAGAFRRFRIGKLQDGRDEWLEFWKENHLLAPFDARASNPVTQSFLIPFAPDAPAAVTVMPMEPIVLARLRTTAPASPLHLSLVEIVRRRYIAFRKDCDRLD